MTEKTTDKERYHGLEGRKGKHIWELWLQKSVLNEVGEWDIFETLLLQVDNDKVDWKKTGFISVNGRFESGSDLVGKGI